MRSAANWRVAVVWTVAIAVYRFVVIVLALAHCAWPAFDCDLGRVWSETRGAVARLMGG